MPQARRAYAGWLLAALVGLSLGGCTIGQARQDVGDIRAMIRDAIGQIKTGTSWRDVNKQALAQDKFLSYRREARILADDGDFEAAKVMWDEAEKVLDEFKPAKDKMENVIEAVDLFKEAIRKDKENSSL